MKTKTRMVFPNTFEPCEIHKVANPHGLRYRAYDLMYCAKLKRTVLTISFPENTILEVLLWKDLYKALQPRMKREWSSTQNNKLWGEALTRLWEYRPNKFRVQCWRHMTTDHGVTFEISFQGLEHLKTAFLSRLQLLLAAYATYFDYLLPALPWFYGLMRLQLTDDFTVISFSEIVQSCFTQYVVSAEDFLNTCKKREKPYWLPIPLRGNVRYSPSDFVDMPDKRAYPQDPPNVVAVFKYNLIKDILWEA